MITADLHPLLVRHGKAEASRPWAFLGRGDSPLGEEGRTQARELAGRLSGTRLDAIYTSPLLRALQTAEILGLSLGLELQPGPRLVEQDYGAWEGLRLKEAFAKRYLREEYFVI